MATGRLDKFWRRLRATLRPGQVERELDEELEFHLAARAEKNRAMGMDAEQARFAARRQLGNATRVKEEARGVRVSTVLEAVWRDFTYGLRTLRKRPGFTLVAVATLGLGIGASTAIFSVVENILVEPFPYPHAERFMTVEIHDVNRSDAQGRAEYSAPEYLDYVEKNHVFDLSIANASEDVLYTAGEGVERFHGVLVTPNTFEFFGMPALIGRVLQPADYEPVAAQTFVLRYKTWMSEFAGDPGVLGKTFLLNGVSRTLVGVMPPRFGWGNGDLYLPVKPTRTDAPTVAGEFAPVWYLMGRLKPGVTEKQAQADLTVVANQLAKIYPKSYPDRFVVKIVSATDMVVGPFRATLFLMMAAVLILLLIGCSNVANLLLARATTREREFAMRAALGASRLSMIRQQLIESLLLALAGGALGILLAWSGLRTLVSLVPAEVIPAETVIQLNVPALIFAVAVAVATALLFGLVPALHAARKDLNDPLRGSGKGSNSNFRHTHFRDVVTVAEVALSLTLLVGAALLMRSFLQLCEAHLGFQPDNVLVARLPLPRERYQNAEQVTGFFRELLAKVKAIPGVVDATETSTMPPYGGIPTDMEVLGKTHPEKWHVVFELCGDEYANVLQIPFLDGRMFSATETYKRRHVAVVNDTFARLYLNGANPIGQRIRLNAMAMYPDAVAEPWFEVIGVARDILNDGVHRPVRPEAWVPYTVTGSTARGILVRTHGDPLAAMGAVRQAVWSTDRGVALTLTGRLRDYIDLYDFSGPRFTFLLTGIFASVGLVLVITGVYSVVAYATARRTHEIGIRMALGADRASAVRMVVGDGLKLVGLGVVIGVVLSLAVSGVLASELWQVSARDPVAIASVSALLLATGLVASWIPARRAARIEPIVALRHE